MKSKILLITVPVVVLLLVAYAVGMWFSSRTLVQTAQVQLGEIREFIDERGKTRLPETYRITMPFDSRLKPISLQEGQRVKKGELVASLVESDLIHEVDEAAAAVEQLKNEIIKNSDNTLEELVKKQTLHITNAMQSLLDSAEQQQTASKARHDYAKANLIRTRDLLKSGGSTKDDFERAKRDERESYVDHQKDILSRESTGILKAATDLLPQLVDKYIAKKVLTFAVLREQKQEATARWERAKTRQKRGTMTSPIDGVILKRHLSNERFVPAGTVLLEIGRLGDLEVEVDVLSQEAVKIPVEAQVEIYGPAVGEPAGKGIAGYVQRVYPEGFTKISSLGVEEQRVKAVVRFREKLPEQQKLGVDYRVRVRIITRQKQKALLVPRSALFRSQQGDWQVFAIRNGRANRQEVKLGLSNDEQAEIVEGLREGELVVLSPENSLTDRDRVVAEQ